MKSIEALRESFSSGFPQPTGLTEEASLYFAKVSSSPRYDSRWASAELRTAELLSRIQPNEHSEIRRRAVADYVKKLIHRCFDCQVFTFGSVPLKTYLPDGDIDLTAFSRHQHLIDTWANDVQSILEHEERRKDAEFCVREVQCIYAEVKIVKCLVENIVVDISFNQLGGLCTLCFLEEVDHLIERDHLFKRSIILVKAWCYYESRLLGAHHGLISTYALETLVLYIFNVFHASLRGPLEVLFTFLDYFSNFDWDKYCVSLWGPVPLLSIPDLTAEPPLKDGGDLLLSRDFLEACSEMYGVLPKGQDTQSRTFVEKYLNVVDPLRTNNNLGRSVSRANFFRIRSAFNMGARKMTKIFESSDKEFAIHLDSFFSNTWGRHQSGVRPDAPISTFPPFHSFDPKALGLHNTCELLSDTLAGLDDQNIADGSDSSCKLGISKEKFQKLAEVFPSISMTNRVVEGTGGESKIQKSASDVRSLDSSSYIEEVLTFSESFSSQENHVNDSKQDKPRKGITPTNVIHQQTKRIPLRSKSLGKGLCMIEKFDSIQRSTSDGRLEQLCDNQAMNNSRVLQDVQDCIIQQMQSASLDDESITNFGKPSGVGQVPKVMDSTYSRRTGIDKFDIVADRSMVFEKSVDVSDKVSKRSKHGSIRSSFDKDRSDSDFHRSRNETLHQSWVEGQGSVFHQSIASDLSSSTFFEGSTSSNPGAGVSANLKLTAVHDQVPESYPPFTFPSYMPLSGTSMYMPPSAFVGPPLGLNTGKTISDPALNTGVVPLSPPIVAMQIPQGPMAMQIPGVPSVALPPNFRSTMGIQETPFSSNSFEDLEGQPHLWQHEEDQLQQLRVTQPWSYANKSAVLHLLQDTGEHNSSDADITAEGKRDVKFARVKAASMALKNKRSSANVSTSDQENFVKCTRADNAVSLATDGSAASRIVLENEVKSFEGTASIMQPLPAMAPGLTFYPSPLPHIPHQSVKTDRVAVVPAAIPFQASNQIAVPLPGANLPDGQLNTFQSSILEREGPSQEGIVGNHLVPGASAVYFSTNGSFPTFPYYTPFYADAQISGRGFGIDASDMGPYIIQQDDADSVMEGDCQINPPAQVCLDAGETVNTSTLRRGSGFASAAELATSEPSRDLLSSDFMNHRQNLAFGRWCQDPGMYSFAFSPPILQAPNYVHGPVFWDCSHRPFYGNVHMVPGNVQASIPGSPLVQDLTHMTGSVPNTLSGHVAFGIGNTRKPQAGTGTYLPLRHGLYKDAQHSSGRNQMGEYSEVQGRPGNMGIASRQRSRGRGLNSTDGNPQAYSVSVDRRTSEGQLGGRNTWRQSHHPASVYSPVAFTSSATTWSPCDPFRRFPHVNFSVRSEHEPGSIATLSPSNSSGDGVPLVAGQLEFGSLGPVQVGTVSGQSSLGQRVGTVAYSSSTTGETDGDPFPSLADTHKKQTSQASQQRHVPDEGR